MNERRAELMWHQVVLPVQDSCSAFPLKEAVWSLLVLTLHTPPGAFCLRTSEENKQIVVRRETALTFSFDSSIQRASRCELRRNTEREMRRDRASIQLMVLFCLQHISAVQAGKSLLITTSPIGPVVSVSSEARSDTDDINRPESPRAEMFCQDSFSFF